MEGEVYPTDSNQILERKRIAKNLVLYWTLNSSRLFSYEKRGDLYGIVVLATKQVWMSRVAR
jgi:hypothetical protein